MGAKAINNKTAKQIQANIRNGEPIYVNPEEVKQKLSEYKQAQSDNKHTP